MEADGNEVEPINVPEDAPASTPFDYSQYENEDAGNNDCLEHHKKQLEVFGVQFGRGAFKMYDLHKEKLLYSICTSLGQVYNGNVDGCVSPFGLMVSSAGSQCRIVYERKQSSIQKERRRPSMPQSQRSEHVSLTGSEKGQVITALLAAYSYNPFPVIFDLTDGEVRSWFSVDYT